MIGMSAPVRSVSITLGRLSAPVGSASAPFEGLSLRFERRLSRRCQGFEKRDHRLTGRYLGSASFHSVKRPLSARLALAVSPASVNAPAVRAVVRMLECHVVVIKSGGKCIRPTQRAARDDDICAVAVLALLVKDLQKAVAVDAIGRRIEHVLFCVAPVTIRRQQVDATDDGGGSRRQGPTTDCRRRLRSRSVLSEPRYRRQARSPNR